MVTFIVGLIIGTLSASDFPIKIICISLLTVLLIASFFLITDGIVPAIQNKAVLIVDENGITDVVSWGLIKWSNIKDLKPAKVVSGDYGTYSFTEMRILLKDLDDYECYRNNWWIRLKVKWMKIYRGKTAHVIMDIDALKGNAEDVFESINESYKYFTSAKMNVS